MRELNVGVVSRTRLMMLFVLFFCVCLGLGYPMLNRVDWRKAPGGLDDVVTYAAMVTGPPVADAGGHTKFRVLVPYMARPVYRVAEGRVGSWDAVMFSLLVVNAGFVAGTVTLLMMVVGDVAGYVVGLGTGLLYLLNFAVANLRLVGLVDAGEGFFVMAVVWCLARRRYWMLPVCGALGAMAKESFVVFLVAFTVGWWVGSRRKMGLASVGWIVGAWAAALVAMEAVQWRVTGAYQSVVRFGMGMHQNSEYGRHFVGSLGDRNLWYIFFWLLPLGVWRMGKMPLAWRAGTVAACVAAFAMDGFYGGPPGAIGRALFTVAGPLLTASAGVLLFGLGCATEVER